MKEISYRKNITYWGFSSYRLSGFIIFFCWANWVAMMMTSKISTRERRFARNSLAKSVFNNQIETLFFSSFIWIVTVSLSFYDTDDTSSRDDGKYNRTALRCHAWLFLANKKFLFFYFCWKYFRRFYKIKLFIKFHNNIKLKIPKKNFRSQWITT